MADKHYFKDYYKKKRLEVIQRLGGKCQECGTTEQLEFDHINPEDKKFVISNNMKGIHTDKFESELKKCQLLCKKCHYDKTKTYNTTLVPVNKDKWKHGTTTSYMAKKCRCQECRDFYSSYKKARRAERNWS